MAYFNRYARPAAAAGHADTPCPSCRKNISVSLESSALHEKAARWAAFSTHTRYSDLRHE
jgi:hypothetical protein